MDVRVTNRTGILETILITKSPELYDKYAAWSMEKLNDVAYIKYKGSVAIDFLIDHKNQIQNFFNIEREFAFYNQFQTFRYVKLQEDAVIPSRARPSETGFDLTLIRIAKSYGNVTLYGTGICVQPPTGFYFDMVPRSSIIKSGYMLANSVGVIDQGYTGEIMVPLIKVDDSQPDLELPKVLVQLIPRRWYMMEPLQVFEFEDTNRKDGGFGSTNNV